jgi:hypothetical protein
MELELHILSRFVPARVSMIARKAAARGIWPQYRLRELPSVWREA